MDTTSLFFNMMFGSFGTGYFIYGKRQSKALPLLVGVTLCIFPYMVSNIYVMVAIGVVLLALPFVVKS